MADPGFLWLPLKQRDMNLWHVTQQLLYVCVCMYAYACVRTYMHMYMCLCTYVCTSICATVSICVTLGCSHQHSMAEDTKASGSCTLLCHACLSPHTPQQNVGSTLPLTLRISRLPHEREMGARHACSPSLAFFLSRWYVVEAGNAWQHARLEPGTL